MLIYREVEEERERGIDIHRIHPSEYSGVVRSTGIWSQWPPPPATAGRESGGAIRKRWRSSRTSKRRAVVNNEKTRFTGYRCIGSVHAPACTYQRRGVARPLNADKRPRLDPCSSHAAGQLDPCLVSHQSHVLRKWASCERGKRGTCARCSPIRFVSCVCLPVDCLQIKRVRRCSRCRRDRYGQPQ